MDVTEDTKSVGVRERVAEDETVGWRQMTESVLKKKKKKIQIPKPQNSKLSCDREPANGLNGYARELASCLQPRVIMLRAVLRYAFFYVWRGQKHNSRKLV